MTMVQSENHLQPLGRALITALNASAQSLKLYPFENATVQNVIEETGFLRVRNLRGVRVRCTGARPQGLRCSSHSKKSCPRAG